MAAKKKKTTKKAAPKTGQSLVIVESPAKARTIEKYLGKGFRVRASMGHLRDLPKSRFGLDEENSFEPEYEEIASRAKVIKELRSLARKADRIFLAPDPDREGEAIAWHLHSILKVPDDRVYRVVFNEITKTAILKAFEEPGRVNMNKVNAQQARRVLDRIMGYRLSPLLWKTIARGLSAGRVQSVAVRLIVEREKEIRAFVREEYWRVGAIFNLDDQEFRAELRRLDGKTVEKNLTEERASELVDSIGDAALKLTELESKPKTRRTTPPFTTSQLQQKASSMLRFSAKKTMMVAQQLYEGIEAPGEGQVGLITYMRTDSTRVSNEALGQVRKYIESEYGEAYLPGKPNVFRSKAGAQEAHEAIRPTGVLRTPESLKGSLNKDQYRLYDLIWRKFVASQMKPAVFQVTTAWFDAPEGDARFKAQGVIEQFNGHLRAFDPEGGKREDQLLPSSLVEGGEFKPERLEKSRHETQPPPRFSEATLVKELEKKGIGRPSTYAAIISTIVDRGYVTREARKFTATDLGEVVTDRLVEHFGDLINTDFTSSMEGDLDRVEAGDAVWKDVVDRFNKIFADDLAKAEVGMKSIREDPELSEFTCDKCGSPMAILFNRYGKFLGCSKNPECKNTLGPDGTRKDSEVEETDYTCPKCEKPMVIRSGKNGRFLACTGFPKCKSTANVDEDGKKIEPKKTDIDCDKCGSPMVIRGSRRGPFLACSAYPKCRNGKPLPSELQEAPKEAGRDCDLCGKPMVIRFGRGGREFIGCSGYPECKNTYQPDADDSEAEDAAEAATGAGE